MNSLRFHLHGEGNLIYSLYELCFNNCTPIAIRTSREFKKSPIFLSADRREPWVFEEETLLRIRAAHFPRTACCRSTFAFRRKFLFFDLRARSTRALRFKDQS